jgi:hypothetical protein
MGIARPCAWPNVLCQQSIENIQRMSIAPLWMEMSQKAPERFIKKGIIDHWHYHSMLNGVRLSYGTLKKDSFYNLRAPSASDAC